MGARLGPVTPATQEAQAEGLQVQSLPGLQSESKPASVNPV